MATRPHQQAAENCWRLILALAEPEEGTPQWLNYTVRGHVEDIDNAAINLIEMACDCAAEAQRIADGHPHSAIITWDKDGNRIVKTTPEKP